MYLNTFYMVCVIVKITIDLIQLGNTFHTKYKEYKAYTNENLHNGFNIYNDETYKPF
jgi:hypothetical protein